MSVRMIQKSPKMGNTVTVTFEATEREELNAMQVRQMAIDEANLYRGGLSNNGNIYPVDADGKELAYAGGPAAAYRADFTVVQGL